MENKSRFFNYNRSSGIRQDNSPTSCRKFYRIRAVMSLLSELFEIAITRDHGRT